MYRKVLVPLDGSELAECALTEVERLIRGEMVGEVILLSVVETPTVSASEGIDFPAYRKSRFEKMEAYLDETASRITAAATAVKTRVMEGNAAQTIADQAKGGGADLIVIATHGYSGMKRLMFGSVALQVIHDAHVPVLMIRPESCR